MDAPAVTDPTTALAWGFLVRVALCAVWLTAVVALVAPVRLEEGVDCGTAAGVVFGLEDVPAAPRGVDAESDCTWKAVPQVGASVALLVVSALVGRALLRRLDEPAGLLS